MLIVTCLRYLQKVYYLLSATREFFALVGKVATLEFVNDAPDAVSEGEYKYDECDNEPPREVPE